MRATKIISGASHDIVFGPILFQYNLIIEIFRVLRDLQSELIELMDKFYYYSIKNSNKREIAYYIMKQSINHIIQ